MRLVHKLSIAVSLPLVALTSYAASAGGQTGIRRSDDTPVRSGGFRLERLVIVGNRAPTVSIGGQRWTTDEYLGGRDIGLFVRLPAGWAGKVSPGEYDNPVGLSVTARTSTGFLWRPNVDFALRPGTEEHSEDILYILIPRGWPAGTEWIDVRVTGPSRETARWRLLGLPSPRRNFSKSAPVVETIEFEGVRIHAYAYLVREGRHSLIVSDVVALDDPPESEMWELSVDEYLTDRAMNLFFPGSGRVGPIRRTSPPFIGGGGPWGDYVPTVERLRVNTTLTRQETASESFELPAIEL